MVTMVGKQLCRHCGATGIDPGNPLQKCEQCKGLGDLPQGEPNPVGPGIQRLVDAAQVREKPGAAPMMIAWDFGPRKATLTPPAGAPTARVIRIW